MSYLKLFGKWTLFGLGILFSLMIWIYLVKGVWQASSPGWTADANLYVNGNWNLTATKWNNLVDNVKSKTIERVVATCAWNLCTATATCPAGKNVIYAVLHPQSQTCTLWWNVAISAWATVIDWWSCIIGSWWWNAYHLFFPFTTVCHSYSVYSNSTNGWCVAAFCM